jgi:exodeoxyribonuclease V
MQLSQEQTAALDAIARWRSDSLGKQEFLLAGFAGTGKTTLLQHFVNGQSNQILCLTPTGKAASVLQKKLKDITVSTIHKALYVPVPKSRQRLKLLEQAVAKHPNDKALVEALKEEIKKFTDRGNVRFSPKSDHKIEPGQLVVVDEASMVTKYMREDLLRTGAKVLYVGDPGQLPPVKDVGFFQHTPPDAMLEQIQRQALDSPIIRLSMMIREGEKIDEFDDGSCRRISKHDMPVSEWWEHDQVITGSNASRRRINRFFRRKAGRTDWWPAKGEKLICLKNVFDEEICLVNGGMAESTSDFVQHEDLSAVWGDLKTDEGPLQAAQCDPFPFHRHYDHEATQAMPDEDAPNYQFDFGYAITVHKSQGSEWDRVILADDGMADRNQSFRRKWLYTAVTRAREKLTWLY